METILETTHLTKTFGHKDAVHDVSMTIQKGDIYGFIGKNGAGKTTFMRLVLGTAFPSAGTIHLFGDTPLDTARRKTGALIEAPGLYKNCTAKENMRLFALLSGGAEADIDPLLALVGLSDTGKKKAGKFSLGMKQRLGIAIALLGNPEFLVLDEPINGLDPSGIKEVRDLILKLNQEKGITFLISSHLLDELAKVVTKYGIINNGNLVEEISASQLQQKCQKTLKISVDDPQKAADILKGVMSKDEITLLSNAVLLTSHVEEGAKLNMLLSKEGILVSGIEAQTDGMEKYFIDRIGE